MTIKINKILQPKTNVESTLNEAIDAIHRIVNFSITGPGVSFDQGPSGVSITVNDRASTSARRMFIYAVDTDATGGGHYNCVKQTIAEADWDSDNSPFTGIGDPVVVLNLAEAGSSVHNLDAGDLIMCFNFTDDEGNTRLVGNEVFGRHTFGEW